MNFTWDPPVESLQNGDIISYTLICSLNLEIATTVLLGATEQYFTIDLFSPGTTFQCQVYATNSFGDGPPANLDVITDSKNKTLKLDISIIVQIHLLQISQWVVLCICASLILGQTKSSFLSLMMEHLVP